MAMDQLREEYNKDGQKVVFIATSDDFHWIKKHLVDKQARMFSEDITSFPKSVFGLSKSKDTGRIFLIFFKLQISWKKIA